MLPFYAGHLKCSRMVHVFCKTGTAKNLEGKKNAAILCIRLHARTQLNLLFQIFVSNLLVMCQICFDVVNVNLISIYSWNTLISTDRELADRYQ